MIHSSSPQLPPLGQAIDLFSESAAHRAELAGIELAEAGEHATGSLMLAAATMVLGLVTGFALTVLLASLVWDSPNRAWWLTGFTLFYLVGAVATALTLRRRLNEWHPMSETQFQLQQDHQCLGKLIKSFNS